MLDDKQLIWRFNLGDRSVLHDIYEQYKTDLVSLAAALLIDKTAAEDAVHEVFIRFTQSKRFVLTGSLKGYLSTCVANQARNFNRSRQCHQRIHDSLEPGGKHAHPPLQIAGQKEQQQHIMDALENLPYEQREVIVLRVHSDLRLRQIAKIQKVSINTVHGRYRYGMERLKQQLVEKGSQFTVHSSRLASS